MPRTGTFVLVLLLAAAVLAVVVVEYVRQSSTSKKASHSANTAAVIKAAPTGRWAVIGTGISAAAVIHYMDPRLRASASMREGSARFGGRILTQAKSISPMNTLTQALEFGAWLYDTFGHTYVKAFLLELQVPTFLQIFTPGESFTYFGGVKQPWPAVPTFTADMSYKEIPAEEQNAWLAHTGVPVALAPNASAKSVWNLTIPITAATVTGLGWQAVPFYAIKNTSIQYNRLLNKIEVKDGVNLSYASGETENVQGVVLTCPAADLVNIKGITADAQKCLQTSFTHVTLGVLYVQWTASTIWWPQLGFDHAVAATDTPLGRIGTCDNGVLRCKLAGEATVNYWTDLLVNDGVAAAGQQVAVLLAKIFGQTNIPPPAFVSFRGWPHSLPLWNFGVNKDAVRACILRPCGSDAPVWWTSGDVSNNQGWVEGCVEAAVSTARAINAYVTG
jgi:hypothetical protein